MCVETHHRIIDYWNTSRRIRIRIATRVFRPRDVKVLGSYAARRCKVDVGEPLGQRQGPRIIVEKDARCTAMRCVPSPQRAGVGYADWLVENTQALGRPLGLVDEIATSPR